MHLLSSSPYRRKLHSNQVAINTYDFLGENKMGPKDIFEEDGQLKS